MNSRDSRRFPKFICTACCMNLWDNSVGNSSSYVCDTISTCVISKNFLILGFPKPVGVISGNKLKFYDDSLPNACLAAYLNREHKLQLVIPLLHLQNCILHFCSSNECSCPIWDFKHFRPYRHGQYERHVQILTNHCSNKYVSYFSQ